MFVCACDLFVSVCACACSCLCVRVLVRVCVNGIALIIADYYYCVNRIAIIIADYCYCVSSNAISIISNTQSLSFISPDVIVCLINRLVSLSNCFCSRPCTS